MDGRPKATKLLDMCRDGALDPLDVLMNVLVNYMSSDDADDFAATEYDIELDDEAEDDEPETKTEYVCTLDGLEIVRFDNERDAMDWCRLYDGDKDAQYEEEEVEVE